jgi:hypothetical protein
MTQLLQDIPNVVFQHDGAPPDIHSEVTTLLNRQLPELWICWGGGIISWPPRYPEQTPLKFFLWGFVKDEAYVLPGPINVNNLKDRIRIAIAKIDQPLL